MISRILWSNEPLGLRIIVSKTSKNILAEKFQVSQRELETMFLELRTLQISGVATISAEFVYILGWKKKSIMEKKATSKRLKAKLR